MHEYGYQKDITEEEKINPFATSLYWIMLCINRADRVSIAEVHPRIKIVPLLRGIQHKFLGHYKYCVYDMAN